MIVDREPAQASHILKVVPIAGIRKTMADSCMQSSAVPQFTQVALADATELEKRKRDARSSLTYMDLLLDAVCRAAIEVRDVLCAYSAGNAVHFRHADIGIATATDRGLLIPVLRRAETMSLSERAPQWRRLIERTRNAAIDDDETMHPSIVLSNLGNSAVDFCTPLLAPGVSTVVAFGALSRRPFAVGSKIEARPSIYISTSFDHRIIDGEISSRFTSTLKGFIEHRMG
ncbi:2-oxo acid dehydrogenase subunit E2 [Brucella pecoris]|uniref:2-oxo acid dehydrogenase subunit E2 n=2 Tax=Brucella pecoris TaxID=867683 RepID=A0A5C5CEC3_9HYPH|nr:2-oxo acid dehydrogenase subunit E2 [Brucella pecoris]TNV09106.1 2-oxo acid dehydrogenase subunit E2 [Brucella pecoris]